MSIENAEGPSVMGRLLLWMVHSCTPYAHSFEFYTGINYRLIRVPIKVFIDHSFEYPLRSH